MVPERYSLATPSTLSSFAQNLTIWTKCTKILLLLEYFTSDLDEQNTFILFVAVRLQGSFLYIHPVIYLCFNHHLWRRLLAKQ